MCYVCEVVETVHADRNIMVAHRAAHRDGRAAAARAAGVVILDHAVHIDDNMRGIRVVRQRNRNGRLPRLGVSS